MRQNLSDVVRRVVAVVCGVVHRHAPQQSVDTDAVFDGGLRSNRITRLSRQIIFYALHDACGMTYGEIARLAGISKRKVMRSVSLIRDVSCIWDGLDEILDDVCLELSRSDE